MHFLPQSPAREFLLIASTQVDIVFKLLTHNSYCKQQSVISGSHRLCLYQCLTPTGVLHYDTFNVCAKWLQRLQPSVLKDQRQNLMLIHQIGDSHLLSKLQSIINGNSTYSKDERALKYAICQIVLSLFVIGLQ